MEFLPLNEKIRSLLLFGPPGCGKGTMGNFLATVAGHFHLSSGDIFRGLSPLSPAGKLSSKFLSQGLLVPDKETIAICKNYIDGLIATNRFFPDRQLLLMDGIPRNPTQVDLLAPHLNILNLIVLEVKEESTLIERVLLRAKKEGRVDDSKQDVIEKRMHVYKEQTAGMLRCYPKEKITKINADQAPVLVLSEILNKLGSLLIA